MRPHLEKILAEATEKTGGSESLADRHLLLEITQLCLLGEIADAMLEVAEAVKERDRRE